MAAPENVADLDLSSLSGRVNFHIGQVIRVANRSSHIKGNFKRYFKDAASSMKEIMETLVERNSNEEVRKLERANRRLQEDMRRLREEVQELRELRGHASPVAT